MLVHVCGFDQLYVRDSCSAAVDVQFVCVCSCALTPVCSLWLARMTGMCGKRACQSDGSDICDCWISAEFVCACVCVHEALLLVSGVLVSVCGLLG